MATALAVRDDDVMFVAVRDDRGGPTKLWRLHPGDPRGAQCRHAPGEWQDITDAVYRSVALNVADLEVGPNGKLFVTATGAGFLVGRTR